MDVDTIINNIKNFDGVSKVNIIPTIERHKTLEIYLTKETLKEKDLEKIKNKITAIFPSITNITHLFSHSNGCYIIRINYSSNITSSSSKINKDIKKKSTIFKIFIIIILFIFLMISSVVYYKYFYKISTNENNDLSSDKLKNNN